MYFITEIKETKLSEEKKDKNIQRRLLRDKVQGTVYSSCVGIFQREYIEDIQASGLFKFTEH